MSFFVASSRLNVTVRVSPSDGSTSFDMLFYYLNNDCDCFDMCVLELAEKLLCEIVVHLLSIYQPSLLIYKRLENLRIIRHLPLYY